MDPVGEVDIGAAGRSEEDAGAFGQADVGVAGGVVALVALGLDDGAAAAVEEEGAADEVAGDLVDGALEEVAPEAPAGQLRLGLQDRSSSSLARTAPRVSAADSSCAVSGTEPVPPAIRFDSSQLLRRSTA
ncbi:MAG: hypothetical protein QOF23_1263 [Solirubrobacterales bacterium]|nr:hypothetical protein [Solirubrobacterales bacterium]